MLLEAVGSFEQRGVGGDHNHQAGQPAQRHSGAAWAASRCGVGGWGSGAREREGGRAGGSARGLARHSRAVRGRCVGWRDMGAARGLARHGRQCGSGAGAGATWERRGGWRGMFLVLLNLHPPQWVCGCGRGVICGIAVRCGRWRYGRYRGAVWAVGGVGQETPQ